MVSVQNITTTGFCSKALGIEGLFKTPTQALERDLPLIGLRQTCPDNSSQGGGTGRGCQAHRDVLLNLVLAFGAKFDSKSRSRSSKKALSPARELDFQKHDVLQNVRKKCRTHVPRGHPTKWKTALGPRYGSTACPSWCPCGLHG